MTEKSQAESCALSKENIAAMLALIGKEEASTTSPTAIVMLTNLKENMKILFDRMIAFDHNYAMVRIGHAVQVDDYFYEYGFVQKIPGVTKMKAMASFLNSIQQQWHGKHLQIVGSDETSEGYEFIVGINTDPF